MTNLGNFGIALGATAVVLTMNATQADACGVGDVDFEITATSLNVRAGAGTQYPVIGSVKKGQIVRPFEAQNNGGWGKIQLANGKTGWISMQYTKSLDTCNLPEEESTNVSNEAGWDGIVNVSSVEVKEDATNSSNEITTLSKGDEVSVVNTCGDWLYVEYKHYGKFNHGFVPKNTIVNKSTYSQNNISNNTVQTSSIKTVVTPGCKNLMIRTSHSTTSKAITKVAYGSKIETVSKKGDWYEVKGKDAQGNSFHGWAHSNYIR